jgi:hypothetical protein
MSVSFLKPKAIVGNLLVLRNAEVADAEFILQLRTDPLKGKFLSYTPNDLHLQIIWLEKYLLDLEQVYLIIQDKFDDKYGTVRLYYKKCLSFSWRSWILKEGSPAGFAVESALIM